MSIRLPRFPSVVPGLGLKDTPYPVSLASDTFVPNTMDHEDMPEDPSSERDTPRDLLKTEVSWKAYVHARAPVLNRLTSSQVGRPLWDYRSDTELLQGLLDAVNVHELLWKHQIIPSDINAESVLLAEDPDVLGATGFLSDIEATHMPQDAELFKPEYSSSATKDEGNLRPISITEATNKRKMAFPRHGCVAVVGNPQFMAIELLHAAITSQTIQHTAEHDIESFTWVLGYCVLRKLCNKAYAIQKEGAEHKFMNQSFSMAFEEESIEDILWSRQMAKPFAWCDDRASGFMEPFFQEHISSALRLLLQDILHIYPKAKQNRPPSERRTGVSISPPVVPLTHCTLRQRIQYAIDELRIDPSCDRNH